MEVCLSLGSNLGDRLAQLVDCRNTLSEIPFVEMRGQSAVYETDPVDVPDEFSHLPFLNAVVLLQTVVPALELFDWVKSIESDLSGGHSHRGNRPRMIDIDMIYADDTFLETDKLVLPHPRAESRRFVLEPLAELRGDMLFPGTTSTVSSLLAALPMYPGVSLLTKAW
jgi:2-amino-4-hydroxy-6-hydroxymethyldihydropteridine diphosphokinase